jgi:hypothetical protein
MTLAERLQIVRTACEEALSAAPLSHALAFLAQRDIGTTVMAAKLQFVARTQVVPPDLFALKQQFETEFPDCGQAVIERAMLLSLATAFLPSIPDFPADESVKHLLCKEVLSYAKPPATLERFTFGHYNFTGMCKIVLGERFPGGVLHWEVSGIPRNWFFKMPPRRVLPALWFTLKDSRGYRPFFVSHMGGLAARIPLVTEREFLKSFCRVSLALEQNPDIKGFMAVSWIHSEATHRVSPHLSFVNRPFLESGGCYFEIGPDRESEAFLEGDPTRAELYRSGKYIPILGGMMCSRRQLLDWRRRRPDIVSSLTVR